jgi:hypothetical protein
MVQQQAQAASVASSMAAWITVHEAAALGISDRAGRIRRGDGGERTERISAGVDHA